MSRDDITHYFRMDVAFWGVSPSEDAETESGLPSERLATGLSSDLPPTFAPAEREILRGLETNDLDTASLPSMFPEIVESTDAAPSLLVITESAALLPQSTCPNDAAAPITLERWDAETFSVSGRTAVNFAALMPGASHFDRDLFQVSHDEAVCIDPQARLLLETTQVVLTSRAASGGAYLGRSLGVFLGSAQTEYGKLLPPSAHQASRTRRTLGCRASPTCAHHST